MFITIVRAIVWLRRDLRLADNPALTAASKAHDRLIPVYIDDSQHKSEGAASRWWLHHALKDLRDRLREKGSDLLLFQGESRTILERLRTAVQADAYYWNRVYEPAMTERDRDIKVGLKNLGLEVRSFKAGLLFEPWEIQTGKKQPFRVFTPYWKQLLQTGLDPKPLDTSRSIPPLPEPIPDACPLETLKLLPGIGWDRGFYEAWNPTESSGRERLRLFCETSLEHYAETRNLPSRNDISRLSPYLHCGQLSPRQCVAAATPVEGMDGPWIRELAWREFTHHVLYHYPHTVNRPMDQRFERFPWVETNAETLARWQQGRTGVPLVDAGMRELWATGWMHNRARMVVASFLTKNLLIHWREGAAWFMDTLVDADLANNTMGWQWMAGCGADAAPYFRIFNPALQGEKFDPEGAYVRRWVLELADVPAKWIHKPWQTPFKPKDYPEPMVDLKSSRKRALEHFQTMK